MIYKIKQKIKYAAKKTNKKILNRLDYIIVCVRFYIYKILYNKNKKVNKKNILILVSRLNNGGAEKVVADISDELSKKYNVILVTTSERKESDYNCSVKRIVLNADEKTNFRILKLVKQLKKLKRDNNITHSISFCSRMNYLNTMSKVNDVTIISIRNYVSKSEKEKKIRIINKISNKEADKIVVVSKELIIDQIQNFNAKIDKISVINNFCDKEKIENILKESTNVNLEKNTIINVGRLTYQKGQKHLIRALRYVVDEIPEAKLQILGQGELEKELQKEIEKLKLKDNVNLLGFKKNPYKYMKKATVFVSTSFYEGMSNVILEAMHCGLPIISTDCKSGTREMIAPKTDLNTQNKEITKEEYGVLVPVIKNEKDELILAEAIIEMLKDKKLREHYSKQSKERIKDFYKEKIINKWFELIEK